MIRACALDFDGVVLESVGVKLAAFKRLLATGPRAAEIARYLDENNGIDRYTKFRFITTAFHGRPYDSAVETHLDGEFNAMVLDAVVSCPFVPGAEEFISSTELPLFIVSAMPLRDLRVIVERRGLTGRFRTLYGSPGSKADQLREIFRELRIDPSELAFVGDSPNDLMAARAAGIRFIGRRNIEEFGHADAPILPDLRGLEAALSGAGTTRS